MPELKVKIGGDGSGFAAAMAGVEARARKGAATLSQRLGGAFNPASFVGNRLAGLIGIGALEEGARRTIKFGSDIHDLAKETNLSFKQFQEWGFAAQQNSASLEDVSRAFKGLSKARREAMQNPTGETAEAFGTLGVSPADIKNLSQNDLGRKIADTFRTTDFGDQQEALAEKVFGKGGTALLATFQDDLAALSEEANRLGIILEDKVISNLDKLGDELSKIAAQVRGPFASGLLFIVRVLNAAASSIAAQFQALGHISAAFTSNPFTESGRAAIKQAFTDAATAMQGAGVAGFFRELFKPEAAKAEETKRREVDASPLVREKLKAERAVRPDIPPLGELGKVGGFVGGIDPAVIAGIVSAQQRLDPQLAELKQANNKLGAIVNNTRPQPQQNNDPFN